MEDLTTRLAQRLALALAAFGLGACLPDVEVDEATVRSPRLLAARPVPAEAAPGEPITWEALVAAPVGATGDAPSWSRCDARRPLAELGPVARACFDDEGARTVLGEGLAVATALPRDSCSLFGPNPPPAKPGEAGGRPVDADRTGGYYHPFVVSSGGERDAAFARVYCGIAGATQGESARYASEYRRNTHPALTSIALVRANDSVELIEGTRAEVHPGESLFLEARWAPESAERYLRRDESGVLGEAAEELRVSFFVTGGEVRDPRAGTKDSARTSARTAFVAPATPGEVRVWAVLRDDRGGVGWSTRSLNVVTP
jgi:hypothetical protein